MSGTSFSQVGSPMTIRITVIQEGEVSRLRVDGRLVGDDSAELLRVCDDLPGPKTLELGGLRFVDARAIGVLRHLQVQGIAFVGASPYVRLLLGRPATERVEGDEGVERSK
jgi:hypothetical protein